MKSLGAVVLAAGGSSRLGYPKQLIEYEGASLVHRAVTAARDLGCRPIILVLGAYADKVLAAIHDLNGITPCINVDWKSGLASSIRFGLQCAQENGDMDALLVTLADQPLVTEDVLTRLSEAYFAGHRIVAASYNGVIGVPAIFGAEYFNDLSKLEGDRGAGSWLNERRNDVWLLKVAEASLDIDTEADVNRLFRRVTTSE